MRSVYPNKILYEAIVGQRTFAFETRSVCNGDVFKSAMGSSSNVCILLTLFFSYTHFTELERSLSNSLLNLEASNAELEKFKLERAQLHAQMESVSNGDKQKS